uniref:methylmalonyl-CoA mutase subunit beta n=1 Tax=Flavobacterium sp. TaxID=239 RepID=UPI00404B9508
MPNTLFNEFETVSAKAWKQKIQYELKGADYNETLVWESLEGIKVKPFYHADDAIANHFVARDQNTFTIIQPIFVHDVQKSNQNAINKLSRGAEAIHFTIENEKTDIDLLFQNLPKEAEYLIEMTFLSVSFLKKLQQIAVAKNLHFRFLIDPIGHLTSDGNWFENQKTDVKILQEINGLEIPFLTLKTNIYQEAGANITQQIAYTLAHLNEYFNAIPNLKTPITIEVAVGANYFFEIAKLRAIRLTLESLAAIYDFKPGFYIWAKPSKRNKTLYDYNVNMLRTTTECMSAVLGSADAVTNLPYDAIYHKDNEFGNRIARNQLLILKEESYLDAVQNPADGAYYIESLTQQLAEKALTLFKDIEANGGFITQLIEGTIQRKIGESAQKEQDLFDNGSEILLGTNKYPNKNDRMKNDLELFPFVKTNPRKTLITPIIPKRLAEKMEQERLNQE